MVVLYGLVLPTLDSLSVLFSDQDCRSVHVKCLLASKLCEQGRQCPCMQYAAEAAGSVSKGQQDWVALCCCISLRLLQFLPVASLWHS